MGSQGGIVPPAENRDEVTVMVTGFAPFRAGDSKNPSWEITRLLPPYLPSPKGPELAQNEVQIPKVKILIHPEPIKVAYKTVREIVPKLWDHADEGARRVTGRGVDYMIHIGMASGRRYYSIERKAHREGYKMKDVDGEILEDDGGRRHSRKDRIAANAVEKHDYEAGTQPLTKSGPTPSNNEGVEGWINKAGETGESIEEVVRNQATKNIVPNQTPLEKTQKVMPGRDATGDAPRQETPKETQESQQNTRQEDAPSEAWLAQKARYGTQRTTTSFRRPSDSKEIGELKEDWIWEGLPKTIYSDLDIDKVWKLWMVATPSADTRISDDAGHYLCDFIYYSSLAELTKRDERKRVLFFHVPVEVDDENIAKGVEIVCELIRAIVTSDVSKFQEDTLSA